MFWLISGVFALLIFCTWLEDEKRLCSKRINKLADESRKKEDVHKPNNILWVP